MAMRRFWRGILMMAAVLLGPDAGHAQPYRAPDHPPYPAWVVDGVVATITNPRAAPLAERLLAMSRTGEFYGDVALDPADLLLRTPPARAHAVANTLTARIATLGGPALAPAADVALALSRQAPARHQALIRTLAALATSRDPEVQWSVALVAVSIADPEARMLIDAMIEHLPTVAPPALWQWARTLSRLSNDPRRGKAAEALLARLRKGDLMANPDEALRGLSWALNELTEDAPEYRAAAMRLLLPRLASPDPAVRKAVVEMLGWFPARSGPAAWPTPCPLLPLLDDPILRGEVLRNLEHCIGNDASARADLVERLLSLLATAGTEEIASVYLAAFDLTADDPERRQRVVEQVLSRLPNESSAFRVAASGSIGHAGTRLHAAWPGAGETLLGMLDDPQVLPDIDQALRGLLPLDAPAMDRFLDRVPAFLQHPEGRVRSSVVSLMQGFPWRDGPWREVVIERMLALMDDPYQPAMGWANQVLRRRASLDARLDEMLMQRMEQPQGRRVGQIAFTLRIFAERNPIHRGRIAAAFVSRLSDPDEPDWIIFANELAELQGVDHDQRRIAVTALATRVRGGSSPSELEGATALATLAQHDAALRPLAIETIMARWAGWDDPYGNLAVAVGQLAAAEPTRRPDVVAALLDRLHRSTVETGMAGPLVGLLLQPKPLTVTDVLAQPPLAVQRGDPVLSEALAVVLTGGRMTDAERAKLRLRLGR